MNILEMKPHPLAAKMPAQAKHERAALKQSMEEQGFDPKEPIVIWNDPKLGEDRILDGVNRRDVAKELGIDRIPTIRFEGDRLAAVKYVHFRQIARRSPNPSQRAAIVASYREDLGLGIEKAAEVAGVSVSQMEKASSLKKKSKKLSARAMRGEISVNQAIKSIERITPETHDANEDPWDEIQATKERLIAARAALIEWSNKYLDPCLDRRGGEMLKAAIGSRARVVAGKRVEGLGMIEEMLAIIQRNMPNEKCPVCKGAGCDECKNRRYITAHEKAQAKNAERNGAK